MALVTLPAVPQVDRDSLRAMLDQAHLSIVVLTGAHDPAVEPDLMEAGAEDCHVKPLDPGNRLIFGPVSMKVHGYLPASR